LHNYRGRRGSACRDNLPIDGIEKADEFEVAVALLIAPDDGAVEHAQGGKRGGGAVRLVVARQVWQRPGL
jgi:hypothetical protein